MEPWLGGVEVPLLCPPWGAKGGHGCGHMTRPAAVVFLAPAPAVPLTIAHLHVTDGRQSSSACLYGRGGELARELMVCV